LKAPVATQKSPAHHALSRDGAGDFLSNLSCISWSHYGCQEFRLLWGRFRLEKHQSSRSLWSHKNHVSPKSPVL